ncbi:hypothetical protein Tco_0085451 [Tanacetum coccineum]
MVTIQPKFKTTSNNTTEAPEVSSLDRQGVYLSQECTATRYSRDCSSRKPKPEAVESARPYAVRRPVMSTPAGSIPRSSHPSGS